MKENLDESRDRDVDANVGDAPSSFPLLALLDGRRTSPLASPPPRPPIILSPTYPSTYSLSAASPSTHRRYSSLPYASSKRSRVRGHLRGLGVSTSES